MDTVDSFNCFELQNFLEDQGIEGFYNNTVIKSYTTNAIKQGVITKGTKLVKSFKYFVKNKEVLHILENMASQIIQENKVKGKLCFSVHPLDYLSISENTYNWRSCHALDGEYRAGNLSYMMDNCTIVCYLKGEEETKLPNFPFSVPWNSKKWRVLLYLSNDWTMIFAGKQYPFSSTDAMQKLINIFNQKIITTKENFYYLNAFEWSDWHKTKIEDFTLQEENTKPLFFDFINEYIPMQDGFRALDDLVKDTEGSKHFNDVLNSTSYDPIYTYLIYNSSYSDKEKYKILSNSSTHFEVGYYTYCLRCGKAEVFDCSDTMMCYDCELKYGNSENDTFGYCKECGARIVLEESTFVNGFYYCNKHVQQCSKCGEYNLIQNMYYDEEDDSYRCKYCY